MILLLHARAERLRRNGSRLSHPESVHHVLERRGIEEDVVRDIGGASGERADDQASQRSNCINRA